MSEERKATLNEDAVLRNFSRRWKLDGDLMYCRGCNRAIIFSRRGEEIHHQNDCPQIDQKKPWDELQSIISTTEAEVTERNKLIGELQEELVKKERQIRYGHKYEARGAGPG